MGYFYIVSKTSEVPCDHYIKFQIFKFAQDVSKLTVLHVTVQQCLQTALSLVCQIFSWKHRFFVYPVLCIIFVTNICVQYATENYSVHQLVLISQASVDVQPTFD